MFIERTLFKCLYCIELKITFKIKKKKMLENNQIDEKNKNKQKYLILESIIIS